MSEIPKPVRYSAMSWSLLSLSALWLAFFLVVPTIKAFLADPLPPFAELAVHRGVATFKYDQPRVGPYTIVTDSNGVKFEYSCATLASSYRGCLRPALEGKLVEIHWAWVKPIYWSPYRYPLQIVMDGEVIRDYQSSVRKMNRSRWHLLIWTIAGSVVFGVFAVYRYAKDRGDHVYDASP